MTISWLGGRHDNLVSSLCDPRFEKSWLRPCKAFTRDGALEPWVLSLLQRVFFLLIREADSHEKSCGEDIAENEEILDLPKPLTPYALLSSPPKRMKTVYEALSMARNTKTLDENEERYSPFPGSPSSPRSSAGRPLLSVGAIVRGALKCFQFGSKFSQYNDQLTTNFHNITTQ